MSEQTAQITSLMIEAANNGDLRTAAICQIALEGRVRDQLWHQMTDVLRSELVRDFFERSDTEPGYWRQSKANYEADYAFRTRGCPKIYTPG